MLNNLLWGLWVAVIAAVILGSIWHSLDRRLNVEPQRLETTEGYEGPVIELNRSAHDVNYPRLHVVEINGTYWLECTKMVSGGRSCRERWTVDEADSRTVMDHLSATH